MRSVLAGVAAIFFLVNATSFIPLGAGVIENSGQIGGLDGDSGALAVTWAARTLFLGLAVLSLALVEWSTVTRPVIAAIFDTPASGGTR
jgi:hypothetical protein